VRVIIKVTTSWIKRYQPQLLDRDKNNLVIRTKTNAGKRDDLGFYVRSTWEANYARYLLFLKKNGNIHDFEYEPDTFWFEKIKKGCRFYIPDFKVWTSPTKFEYHEVKGYMDQKGQTKLNRMARYYPEVKIVLIDKAVYRDIYNKVARLIPNWEGV
jgi:hypothetical protein